MTIHIEKSHLTLNKRIPELKIRIIQKAMTYNNI